MNRFVLALLALTACTDEQNVGNTYTLRASRWSIGMAGNDVSATHVAIDPSGDVIATGTRGLAGWVGKRARIDGAELWTMPFGGASGNFGIEAFIVDNTGNTLIAGRTSGTQPFGDSTVTISDTRFVAKITPAGHTAWVHTFDPNPSQPARGLAVAADGHYYVSTDAGAISAFEPDGTRLWTQPFPAAGPIAITGAGEIEMVATLDRSTTFGTTAIDLQHDAALVVARIHVADGGVAAVHTYGEAGELRRDAVRLDQDDRLVATTHVGSLLKAENDDFMVSASGAQLWRASPAQGSVFAQAIATNGHAVLTAGRVTDGQIDFGDGVLAGAMYIAARDDHGHLADARVFGDPEAASSFWSLAIANDGAIAYTAGIAAPIDFGSGAVAGPGAVIGLFGPPQ